MFDIEAGWLRNTFRSFYWMQYSFNVFVYAASNKQYRDGIHQIVSRFLERFRYMCPLLFSCVFPS
jgi:hypothetical protein